MMDDIRRESQVPTEEECCLRKEDKTLRIVKIVALGSAVKVFPIVELFSANEIDRDFLIEVGLIEIDLEGFSSYRDLQSFP
jgi:hypothetical protein